MDSKTQSTYSKVVYKVLILIKILTYVRITEISPSTSFRSKRAI